MVRYILISAMLLLLPMNNTFLQEEVNYSLIGVNGWDYKGCFGIQDSANTGMVIVPGPSPADSVQQFGCYGWPTQNGSGEWDLQTSFGKYWIGPYPRPEKVVIDFKVLGTVNVQTLYAHPTIIYDDSIGGGEALYMTYRLPIVPDWQTLEFDTRGAFNHAMVNIIGMGFDAFTGTDIYCGVEVEMNNWRFVYNNGKDTVMVDRFGDSGTTDIVDPLPGIPSGFVLHQNYPNPFNPVTNIVYSIPYTAQVRLEIYDLLGQEIATLVDMEQPAGIYKASFDATGISSGTYVYVLRTKDYVLTRKMILIK